MKRSFFLFFTIVSLGVFAQVQKYHRVKVETGKDGLEQMSKKGIAVDHGEYKKGESFTGEFSQSEIELLKQTGLKYTVLINDMTAYYQQRNKESQKNMAAANCKGCPNYLTPANFTLGSMGGFYTYTEMLAILDSMAARFPNLISLRQVVDPLTTFEGRSLYYVKISDNPNTNETEPQVLFTSLHHAREPESLTQLIYFMWYLLEHYNSDPEVNTLVNNLEIYFIPCVNPDGYIYNQTTNPGGGGMWRKNRRDNGDGTFGVDLNRNYGYNWGYDNIGSSPTTSSDSYRGPSAFSEAETQMIKNFCNAHTFELAVNNHTYSNVLVQPYGYAATAYTPDSLTFTEYGMRLTYCDGFTYGSAQQTVGYTANGVSDDWMYGEQNTKPKIYAMTPEAGSVDDGFWPATGNITPIAENTLDQNIYAIRLASVYGEAKDANGPFIQQMGYLKYDFKRLGLQQGSFTVSVAPVGSNFLSVGGPFQYSGLNLLQQVTDSIPFSLVSGLTPGTVVKFLLKVDNGSYTHVDTVTRVYGTPITVFTDNCSAISQWTGTWNISNKYYVSPANSITDSPSGNYATSANTKTTTTSTISLSGAVAAYLEYYARWEIEKNWDYAEIQVSTNGTTFTPLCARYTHPGNSNQDNLNPVYDGFQRTWVKERIDLSAYLGQNIKLRFNLVSDGGVEYDGFYFDDINVKVITASGSGVSQLISNKCVIYPVPSQGVFYIDLPENVMADVQVMDVLGNEVMHQVTPTVNKVATVKLPDTAQGVYFVRIKAGDVNGTYRVLVQP